MAPRGQGGGPTLGCRQAAAYARGEPGGAGRTPAEARGEVEAEAVDVELLDIPGLVVFARQG